MLLLLPLLAAAATGCWWRAAAAEEFISHEFDWETNSGPSEKVISKFSELVADSTEPIDDHRGTANYRKHAVKVLAKRALERVCEGDVA